MIPEGILSLFRKTPIKKAVGGNLHQSRLDLLEAQDNAEYWIGMVKVLKARVARLEGHDTTTVPQVAEHQ